VPPVHSEYDENEEVGAQNQDFAERHKKAGPSSMSTI
jgi:hypothetical protein